MIHVHDLLARLEKVKPTGHNEWVCRCPGHEDRDPSLAVKATDDGRILIHCFAGCETLWVLQAVGLSFADIMPERVSVEGLKPLPWNPRTVLEALAHNAQVLSLLAHDVAESGELTMEQRDLMHERALEILEGAKYATR